MEKIDYLWPNGPFYYYDDQLFAPSTDSFLLSGFPKLRRHERVCDLGSGTGLIGFLLMAREPSIALTGIELNPQSYQLSVKTFGENHLSAQMLCGDLREICKTLPHGSFERVVSNPPYFTEGSGEVSRTIAQARTESIASLADFVKAAAHLVKFGGYFDLVLRSERLSETCVLCSKHGLEPKRLRFIQNTSNAAPSLFLLECKKGAHIGLSVESPLYVRNLDGTETEETKQIYFREKETS